MNNKNLVIKNNNNNTKYGWSILSRIKVSELSVKMLFFSEYETLFFYLLFFVPYTFPMSLKTHH